MSAQQETHKQISGELISLLLPERSSVVRPAGTQESSEVLSGASAPSMESIWRTRLRRISQSELERIKATTFHSSRANPNTLNEAMGLALYSRDPISMVCAWVRCQLLRSPVADYADFVGLGDHAVRDLERIGQNQKARRELDTYSKLLKAWAKLAEQHRSSDPELTNQLLQAREELLDHLPGTETSSTFGLLTRWRYEVGKAAFETFRGLSYGALWTRRNQGALFEFHDLKRIAQTISLLPTGPLDEALRDIPQFKALENAWLSDCDRLSRPRSIAQLHVLLAIADVRLIGSTLHTHKDIRLGERTSVRISAFQEVSWDDVGPVIAFLRSKGILIEGGALERSLRDQFEMDTKQSGQAFEEKLRLLSERQSIGSSMLADLFALRSPDRKKAVLPIFRALKYGEYSHEVSAGALAVLLASDNQEVAELLKQKRHELVQSRIRSGRVVSRLGIERQLWGVEYSDLPFEKGEIQALEWGKSSKLDERDVVKEVLRVGLTKVRPILLRWEALHDRSSIRACFVSSLYHASQHGLESMLGSSARRLKSIAVGGQVPPLPTIRRFLAAGEESLPHHLERDWFDSFARFQAGSNQSDLARLVSTFVASKSDTLQGYLQSRGLPKHSWARIFSALSTSGTVSSKDFETLVQLLGVERSSPWYKLSVLVRETGTIAEALPIFVSQLKEDGYQRLLQGINALKRSYAEDYRERERRRNGEFALGELLQIRQGRNPKRVSSPIEEAAMAFLREIPGLTAKEIRSIKVDGLEQRRAQGGMMLGLLDRAEDRGILQRELVFALQKLVPVNRQASQLTAEALATSLASPLTPPGVLAHLVSKDESELAQLLAQCRAEARERLNSIGVKANALQVEMHVWGVRIDDIKLPRDILCEILWRAETKSEGAQRVLEDIREIGAIKAANALERLISAKLAILTPDLAQLFSQLHRSGVKGLMEEAKIKAGAAVLFAAGTSVPTLLQLERMAHGCEFKLQARHLIGHHFALAEEVASISDLPLSRFMTHLAFLAPQRNASRPKQKAIQRAYINLLASVDLDTKMNRRLLLNPTLDEGRYWGLCKQILRSMGHGESSPLYDLALCLYISDSTRAALRRWGKGTVGADPSFPKIELLRSFCSQILQSPWVAGAGATLRDLLKRKECALASGGDNETTLKLWETVKFLPGVRVGDLVDVPADSHYCRIFGPLLEQAAELKGEQFKPVSRLGAPTQRLLALVAREQEEGSVESERRLLAESERAKKREEKLLADLMAELGDPLTACPSEAMLQTWADTLSTIMKAPKVAMLPSMYPSLKLAVKEASEKGLSYEVAFVRKAVDLFDRSEERRKLIEKDAAN